ncbi:MAG TPA: efflux RND transporter periplasmic adaptor subunit [Woeseiaceae bacterium]|nr:efflux RND transporter periplasmic adaptor subunit [Woeseiaceae bacterium]
MKKFPIIAVFFGLALVAGVYIGRTMSDSQTEDASVSVNGAREILYWVAPMDPNYRRDEPGKSPMGMDLVPVYAGEADTNSSVVRIDPTIAINLGIRTATAIKSPIARTIETVGYVAYDEDTVEHIHPRVDGWIESLVTRASGERVKKGQLLFEFYSPTLVNAQQEFLSAVRSGNASLIEASVQRLSALGISQSEIARLEKELRVRQNVRVTAEADGVIAYLGVREGSYVTPATEIMSVAKLDKIWLLADVLERQATWVAPGQAARVELDYLPGKEWDGVVDYVYPEVDAMTRTLKVRIRLSNLSETLKPNMFARVRIHGDPLGDVVQVPKAAVIRGGDVNRVVVALGDGRFRAQAVTVGIESGDLVAIRRGISAGDEVVVSGQFLIDSESNIDSALDRVSSDE